MQLRGEPAETRRDRSPLVVDALVFLVLGLTVIVWYRSVDAAWFFFDDLALAARGRSFGDLFEPYNGHLSTTYVIVYRGFYEVFGFSHHSVLQLIGLLAYVAVPVALYLTSRGVLGRGWAGLVAIAVAWTRGAALEPAAMNHWATVVGAIVVARALRGRSRRADVVLFVALLLAFGTSGGAVAIAAAAVLRNLLAGASPRRWLAVVVPIALWLAWRPLGDPHEASGSRGALSPGEKIRLVVEANPIALVGVVGGNRVIAGVLWVALVAGLGWVVVRFRRAGAAAALPWVAAGYIWWIGLVQSRGMFGDPHAHRYRYVATVFLVLAVVDSVALVRSRAAEGDERATRVAGWVRRRRLPVWATALAILAVTAALAAANRAANDEAVRVTYAYGRVAEIEFRTLTAVPELSTTDEHSILLGSLSQRELVAASERYGPPPLSRPELDRWLIGRGALGLGTGSPAGRSPCRRASWEEAVAPGTRIPIRAGAEPATVRARRFGRPWVPVGEVPPGTVVPVGSDVSYSAPHVPWQVRIEGGCRAG